MTGELIQSWTLPDEDATQAEFSAENPTVDVLTLPGSPSLVISTMMGWWIASTLEISRKLWKLVLDGPGRQSPSA